MRKILKKTVHALERNLLNAVVSSLITVFRSRNGRRKVLSMPFSDASRNIEGKTCSTNQKEREKEEAQSYITLEHVLRVVLSISQALTSAFLGCGIVLLLLLWR